MPSMPPSSTSNVACISSEIRFQSADVSKADCTNIIDLFSAPRPSQAPDGQVGAVCTLPNFQHTT